MTTTPVYHDIESARDVLGSAPEINPINYDHDQVRQLNAAANEAYDILDKALAANQLPPAPVAEELSSEPIAWMHDKNGRVDVIHKDVKKLLSDWDATKQGTGEGFHRPLATVEHYAIPLYTHPQPAVPDVDDLALMLWENDRLVSSIHTRVEAERIATIICNWIEEQRNDQ